MMIFAIILSLLSFLGMTFLFYWSFSDRYSKRKGAKILKEIRVEMNKMLSDCDLAVERNLFVLKASIEELKAIVEVSNKRIAMLDEKIKLDENAVENFKRLRGENITAKVAKKEKIKKRAAVAISRDEKILSAFKAGSSLLDIAAQFKISISEIETIVYMKK